MPPAAFDPVRAGEQLQRALVHRLVATHGQAKRWLENPGRLRDIDAHARTRSCGAGAGYPALHPLQPMVFAQHRPQDVLRAQPCGDAFEHELQRVAVVAAVGQQDRRSSRPAGRVRRRRARARRQALRGRRVARCSASSRQRCSTLRVGRAVRMVISPTLRPLRLRITSCAQRSVNARDAGATRCKPAAQLDQQPACAEEQRRGESRPLRRVRGGRGRCRAPAATCTSRAQVRRPGRVRTGCGDRSAG